MLVHIVWDIFPPKRWGQTPKYGVVGEKGYGYRIRYEKQSNSGHHVRLEAT